MLTILNSAISRNWAVVDPLGRTLTAAYETTPATSGPPAILGLNADLGVAPFDLVQLPAGDVAYEFRYFLRKQSPGPAVSGYSSSYIYRYFRVSGVDTNCQVRPDDFELRPTEWEAWSPHRSGNQLSLDQARFNLRPMFAFLRDSMSSADFKMQVPGVWEIVQEQYAIDAVGGLISLGTPRVVGTINYRFLLMDNVVVTRPIFDPDSDEGTTTVAADILALPLGWQPDSPLDFYQGILSSSQEPVVEGLTTLSVATPDSNGKIATFTASWDGRDGAGEVVEGPFLFAIAALGSLSGTIGSLWAPTQNMVLSKRAKCECEVTQDGTLQLSQDLSMQSPPVGMPIGPDFSYHSTASGSLPASMGYGWKGASSAALNEQGAKVFYRNEGNRSVSWTLSGGVYLPTESDNYIELAAISGNPDYTFELTFQDQTKRRFQAGKLVQDVDRNDNITSYEYVSSGINAGRLEKVINGVRETRYDYDVRTDGQPRFIEAYLDGVATGRVVELQYYSNSHPVSPDRLQAIVDPAGESQGFAYNAQGQIAAIFDARGNIASQYLYDGLGRVVLQFSYDQLLQFHFYDQVLLDNQLPPQPVPGVNGGVVTVAYDLELHPDYWSNYLDFNDFGGLLDNEVPDRQSARYFDFKGNLIRTEEVVEFAPSALVNITLMAYEDALNPRLMTSVTRPNGSTTTMTYNAQGMVVSVNESYNDTTTVYEYTEDVDTLPIPAKRRNLLRKIHRPALIVNGVPQTPIVVEMDYDANGNLDTVIDGLGKPMTMDVAANGLVNSVTDRRGFTTTFSYDPLTLNLVEMKAPGLTDGAPERRTYLDYDEHDNVTSVRDDLNNEVLRLFDGNNRLERMTDALGQYVEMTYDSGLLVEVESPDNQGSSGDRRRTRMPLSTHYDYAGRLLQVDAQRASGNNFEPRVGYRYTGFSQLRSLLRLKESVTKSWDYIYDRIGRAVVSSDFIGHETVMEHAPFCGESFVNTPRGIRRKTVNDGLCRLTQVETQEERHLFDYDELDRLVKATVGERYAHTPLGEPRQGARYLKSVAEHETSYIYDANDRVTRVDYPNGDTVGYTYDYEGNVLTVTDVHGKVTSYTYYNDGRLKTVSYAGKTFAYSYDAVGRLEEIAYPGGTNLVASFTKTDNSTGWDANGRLLSLRYLQNGNELQRFVYEYDHSGNRSSMSDVRTLGATVTTVEWAYTYDWFNRLLEVRRGGDLVAVYAYDESDNRTMLTWPQTSEVWKYTYDLADRIEKRELKLGAGAFADYETYHHDADGNMDIRTMVASSTVVNYDWNSMNRLRQVKVNSVVQESTSYDHGGIRRLKNDGDNSKYFSSGGMSLADLRPSGEVSFLQGHQLLGLEQGGDVYFFLTDGLGSVRLVVDDAGALQGEFRHDEFGVPEPAVSPLSAPGAELSAHSYVGGLGQRNELSSLGLYYARQRYYDSEMGRWLNSDPIGFSGGLNLYAYVENNPVNGVDPSGLEPDLYQVVTTPEGWQPTAKGVHGRPSFDQAKACQLVRIGVTALYEPADWADTVYDVSQNGLQWQHALAALPFISGAMARAFLRRGGALRSQRCGGFARFERRQPKLPPMPKGFTKSWKEMRDAARRHGIDENELSELLHQAKGGLDNNADVYFNPSTGEVLSRLSLTSLGHMW